MTAPESPAAETPAESPADLLRRAAAKVRESATSATPGPWQWKTWRCPAEEGGPHHVNCPGIDELTHEFEPGPQGWPVHPANVVKVSHSDWPASSADRAWIALMSPALAEPLAAWLEAEASCVETQESVGENVPKMLDELAGEPMDSELRVFISTTPTAVAFARALLDEEATS